MRETLAMPGQCGWSRNDDRTMVRAETVKEGRGARSVGLAFYDKEYLFMLRTMGMH